MPLNNKKAAIVPSNINPVPIMRGAGLIGGSVAGAAGNIGSGLLGGLGFGIGGKVTDLLSKSTLGLKPLILAGVFDAFVYILGESNLFFGVIAHVIFTFLLINNVGIKSRLLVAFLFAKMGAVIYLLVYSNMPSLIPVQVHEFMLLTFLNHALFAYSVFIIFTGVLSNRTGGWLVTSIYWIAFAALIFFAYDQAQGEIKDSLSKYGLEMPEPTQEQRSVIVTFVQGLVSSTKTHGVTVLQAIKNSPKSIANFIDPKVKAAGGEALFGKEKEEQPKLGIVVEPHPSGAAKRTIKVEVVEKVTDPITKKESEVKKLVEKPQIIAKALITIPNPLEDRSFLTVTKIRCYHLLSRSDAEIEGEVLEYKSEALQEGVNVFYGRPLTVSCAFNEEDLGSVSKVKVAVGYDFESNAKLMTYVMKSDILNDLLIRKEDPLDYMAVPPSKRKPKTEYDNGPAKLGIGPVELTFPPIGVGAELTRYVASLPPEFGEPDSQGIYKYDDSIFATPIWYRYEDGDWQWTPYEPKENIWMPVTTTVVTSPGKKYDGQQPVQKNGDIIKYLDVANPRPPFEGYSTPSIDGNYPDFELVIGNKKAEFNGFIEKINNIVITLPNGFSLEDDACPFKSVGGTKYALDEKVMKEKSNEFTTIQSSRLFTCPMKVNAADALGEASYSQVEFNVDVDFTYEAEADVSVSPK